MKRIIKIFIAALSLTLTFTSCTKDDSEDNTVTELDSYNANFLAFIIQSDVTRVAPNYSEGSWNNKKVNGNDRGYAIVNGSYTTWTTITGYSTNNFYKYNNAKVDFSDFGGYEDSPVFTGSAKIDGTIKYTYFMGNTGTYEGSWNLSGSVKCTRKYKGDASFFITFTAPLKYTGTLTFNGTTFQVSDKY